MFGPVIPALSFYMFLRELKAVPPVPEPVAGRWPGVALIGLALGVAYGIWAAAGVALTAVASRFLFAEPLTRRMLAGIGLIVVGVLLVELGAAAHTITP